MRVTPTNILRFWRVLMFPPHDEYYIRARVNRLTDLPWEPWLHSSVWIAVVMTMIIGEFHLFPPADFNDWTWLSLGLVAPPIGFSSQWMLAYHKGRLRYWALWLRMIADTCLSIAILSYLMNRWYTGSLWVLDIMADFVLLNAMFFTLALVWRDVGFLLATEKLAARIRAGDYDA